MLSQPEIKRLADKIFSYARVKRAGKRIADETEMILSDSNYSLTRYANNMITQNVYENVIGLTVRLIKNGRVARASTNRIDNRSLKQLVQATAELTQHQKRDRNLLPLLSKQNYQPVEAYVEETALVSPHDRVEAVRLAVGECEKHQLLGSGVFSNGSSVLALANSKGLLARHQATASHFSCTALGIDSSGWAEEQHKDVTQINPLAIARTAITKALKSQDPIALPAGQYTVIMEPAAVADLLLSMSMFLGALPYQEGRSFLSGRLGKKVMGDNITIKDDAYHPEIMGVPFDFEGTPKQAVTLIEKGIARNLVYDRETARKAKTVSTGHGLPQPNPYGPVPDHLVLAPGDSSLEEMIATTQKGILVTELHYTNLVEPMQLVLTGMTRNGTFLIEDGKITRGIKNMRFTESVLKALSNTELISKDTKYSDGCVVPALKIKDFNFSSETKF